MIESYQIYIIVFKLARKCKINNFFDFKKINISIYLMIEKLKFLQNRFKCDRKF